MTIAELADPITLMVFVLVFVVAASVFRGKAERRGGRRPYRPRPFRSNLVPNGASITSEPTLAVAQLEAVMAASFTTKRVLSRTEAEVMVAAERAIAEAGVRWRVLAQVALGEVLASPDEAAFRAINAKRVDLLVISERSEPLAAIEYQGEGHYQGTAPARDAIKKEALRKAGVRYIEMTPEHGPDDLRRELARMAFALQAGRSARQTISR